MFSTTIIIILFARKVCSIMGSGKYSGYFIVFEGIDGVGKTTHAKLLVDFLNNNGYEAIYTTEPTHWSEYGKKIRASFSYKNRLPVEEEFELFLKDRIEHVKKEVLPALRESKVVVSDRYYFSSVAYQGSRGMDWKYILKRNTSEVISPNLVLLLDIPVDYALKRILKERENGTNSFEKRENLIKVREIFLLLARRESDLINIIDSTAPIEEVHKTVREIALKKLKQYYNN